VNVNPYALLPFVGFIANFALASFVLARNPRSPANRALALVALAVAFWAILKFAWRLSSDADAALLLFRVSAGGWCLLPSLYLVFVVALTMPDTLRSRRLRGVLSALHVIGLLFAASAFLRGPMVVDMAREPWGFVHVPGPAYVAFTAYLGMLFVVSGVLLVRAIRVSADAWQRRAFVLVLAGISIPVVGGLVTNMYLPVMGIRIVELGEVLSTVNVALVAYAMRRYDLLEQSLAHAAETILATMGDALLVAGPRGEVVLANAAAERLLGERTNGLLTKPLSRFVHAPELIAALAQRPTETQQGEGELLAANGTAIPVILSLAPLRTGPARSGIVCVAQDIRRLRAAMKDLESVNERLGKQAVTDDLTGVANRRHGLARLDEELQRAARYGRTFAVGLLDIDGFKGVNDRFGHLHGDRVLQAVTQELRASLRGGDLVSRFGGDEFLLLFLEQSLAGAARVGNRILERIAALRLEGMDATITASVGIAPFNPETTIVSAEELLRRADDALYRAKREGKARLCVWAA
jgi:diguanylate cyclase (GGDEF)-like protein/PAS domain S-box-containing protein